MDLNVFPGLGLRFKENILGCVYLGRVIYVNTGILNHVSANPRILRHTPAALHFQCHFQQNAQLIYRISYR